MRFFKHGESFAIVLPEKIRKSSSVREDEDFEFFEVESGTFVLISKKNLEEQTKKSVFATLLKERENPQIKEPPAAHTINQPSPKGQEPENDQAGLFSRGFIVIANEEEARRVSQSLEKQIKANEIMGIRGFDKKFYIVTGQYFKQNAPKILKFIGTREMSLKDIAFSLKMEENGAQACLMLLKEQGEIIEKRRNTFKLIK
jgi:hypothetical protein